MQKKRSGSRITIVVQTRNPLHQSAKEIQKEKRSDIDTGLPSQQRVYSRQIQHRQEQEHTSSGQSREGSRRHADRGNNGQLQE